jgi:hypothetical protein
MAFTINGCGTRICGGRSFVKWTNRWFAPADFDGLECFCLLHLPLIPYRALHTYDWKTSVGERSQMFGTQPIEHSCRSVPISWSFGLVVQTFLRSWLWLLVILGAGCLIGSIFGDHLRTTKGWTFFFVGVVLEEIGLGTWLVLWLLDRRNRNIRRVLGPTEVYACDPVTWTDDQLARVRKARDLFGTDSYADAVEPLLEAGDFARAMLAARLTAALGRRLGNRTGEALTDMILTDPEVREALAEVRRDPQRWYKVMNAGTRCPLHLMASG